MIVKNLTKAQSKQGWTYWRHPCALMPGMDGHYTQTIKETHDHAISNHGYTEKEADNAWPVSTKQTPPNHR